MENIFNGVSASIIGFMGLITTVDVVLRYVFNSPIPGVYTLSEMLMIGVVFLAIAYVQQKKGHVRVDVFIERIKGTPRNIFELATLILALASFSIMCYQSGLLAWDAWITDDYVPGLIEYPLWPTKTAMTIGSGLLCLRLITDIKHQILELKGNSPHWIYWVLTALIPLLAFSILLSWTSPGQFNPPTVGWIMLVAMIFVLFMGLPVSFGLLLVGIVGYWVLAGADRTFLIVASVPFAKISTYSLSVVPLFILMGHLALQTGFAGSLYDTAQKWVGHIPGGLAQATVVGGAAFGAACGSGLASCATLTNICVPAMRKAGIDDKLAVGSVAATGTIAQMIPPSILMVLYAFITDQSVAKLLIAGIIPGIIAAVVYMTMIYVRCKLNPNLAPQLQKRLPWKERVASLRYCWGIAIVAIIVMGGIYSGIFTPTEAGALGSAGVFLLGFLTKKLKFPNLKDAVMESTKTTAMVFLIIGTAFVFGYFLGISRIPAAISDYIVTLEVHRFVILMGVLLLYIIAGFFIDMLAFAFLTLPIIFPAMQALGYDPIWFGVITAHMLPSSLRHLV
ncbi:MAG: TRAP transporter large permease subunit [Deltaproteobacteria bacterium]|nr:TRAP transporter large permease subunit [Deltaproteobacteria bacterium]